METLDLGGVTVQRDHPVPMRDGVTLAADLYCPNGVHEPLPVLLQRTPYNKRFAQTGVYQHPAWYARQGYVVVVQDTRGRFASEGDFVPYACEAEDGVDTIAWAAALPDTTGLVGTIGFSYAGMNQLLTAGLDPPSLACMAVGCASTDFHDGWTYRGGALQLAFVLSWTIQALAAPDAIRRQDLAGARNIRDWALNLSQAFKRPLSAWLKSGELPWFFNDWIKHEARDEYWASLVPPTLHRDITVPCLHVTGWYDTFIEGGLRNFQQLCLESTAGAAQYLVVGPWQHVPWIPLNGIIDHGQTAENPIDDLQLRWFDHWLKGRPLNEVWSKVRYFLMGANCWNEARHWPPRAETCTLYLHSSGCAGSRQRDGRLLLEPPLDQPPDVFVYDPGDPVPSVGGNSCCRADVAPVGAFDQRGVELRNDVLVYTSSPLYADCDVVGAVELVLHAASDAPDTDWTAKLVDVHPDGAAINICDGILRARYRESLALPKPLLPGDIHQYRISLGATAMRFKAGHAIRLEVSSSNFPCYDANPNTGGRLATEEPIDARLATQIVYHQPDRESRLILTVGPSRPSFAP